MVGNTTFTRDVLVPTYRALGIEWEPGTVGSINDVAPGLDVSTVIDAIVEVVGEEHRIAPTTVSPATLAGARELAPRHVP